METIFAQVILRDIGAVWDKTVYRKQTRRGKCTSANNPMRAKWQLVETCGSIQENGVITL